MSDDKENKVRWGPFLVFRYFAIMIPKLRNSSLSDLLFSVLISSNIFPRSLYLLKRKRRQMK